MKSFTRFLFAALICSLATGTAFSADADRSKKQAEVRKSTQDALQRFYKANPALQGEVKRAPGYAVFTTYGLSFIIGGAGGSGLAHNNKSGNDTFMNMAQASLGVQIGAAQSETLIIFKSPTALSQFVNKGWEFGGGAAADAGVDGKTIGVPQGGGENVIADALYYTLTKNGLTAGGAVAGTKFWKSDELN